MESYRIPIEFAIMLFPFIAFLFTLPFLIHEYRKYGAVPFLKSFLFYSLILYLLTAYLMVILPLPSVEEVAHYTGETMQLEPFRFLSDIKVTTTLNLNDIDSILNFLNKSTVYTVLFNLLMTIPFGIYLKYLFNKKWYQVIIWTFFLSLFFEVTQLTGLYGIYPRPYRIFDVDDLIINTLGGLVGCIISPIVTLFLPSKEELNNKGYIKGQKVRLLRRIIALIIDIVFLCIFTFMFRVIFSGTKLSEYNLVAAIFLYYIVLPMLNNTKTFGKVIVRLEVVPIKGKLSYFKLLLRNIILAFLILYPFSWILILEKYVPLILIYIISATIAVLEVINFFSYLPKKDGEHLFLYERLTNTKNKSTIFYEKKKEELDEEDDEEEQEEEETEKEED